MLNLYKNILLADTLAKYAFDKKCIWLEGLEPFTATTGLLALFLLLSLSLFHYFVNLMLDYVKNILPTNTFGIP